jgi:hypothetical protein
MILPSTFCKNVISGGARTIKFILLTQCVHQQLSVNPETGVAMVVMGNMMHIFAQIVH